MSDQDIWGPASLAYVGWTGTSALDQRITTRPDGNSGIESLVGLDRNEWMVVGIHIHGGELRHSLRVLAVEKEHFLRSGKALPEIAAANGGAVPVTEFHVHGLDPFEALKAFAHEFDLRLRRSIADDVPLEIVELGDTRPDQ